MDFVVRHVSDPCISTPLTFQLKIHILVSTEISLDFHMLLSMMNVVLGFPSLALASLAVPPCMSTMLPKYDPLLLVLTTTSLQRKFTIYCNFDPWSHEQYISYNIENICIWLGWSIFAFDWFYTFPFKYAEPHFERQPDRQTCQSWEFFDRDIVRKKAGPSRKSNAIFFCIRTK